MYIGDNGYYYCEKCHEKDLIENWLYKCPNPIHGENGTNEYLSITSVKCLANALIVAAEITMHKAGMKWLKNLTCALVDQEASAK